MLRLVHETVDAAAAHGRWVGVCGELAGDPAAAVLLAGLGVTELSMAPALIAEVKQALRSVSLAAGSQRPPSGARTPTAADAARALAAERCCDEVVAGNLIRGSGGRHLSTLRSSRSSPAARACGSSLCPVVMALVLVRSYDTIAAIVFLVAAATDWFDGRLARRWGVTTRLGSFLDTTADKLLVTHGADRARVGRTARRRGWRW